MERSSFFNAVIDSNGIPDRVHLAEDFARYFATFIGNGVFPNPSNQCQVVAIDNNMQVRIKAGYAWINGYMYQNTDDYIFKLDPADGVLNRIDRVVLRLDFLERKIKAVVKKGDYASSPIAKTLQRDNDAYEIALADVKINKGIISITQSDITDLRLNKDLCGIVHGTVDQVDTTAIFNQFQSWYSTTKTNYDNDINKWTEDKKKAFDTWYNTNTQAWGDEFQVWFDTLKTKLDGDVATKLTKDVEGLKSQLADKANQTDLTNLSNNFTNFKDTKGKPNGYASLGSDGKVPSTQLPSLSNGYEKIGEINLTGLSAFEFSNIPNKYINLLLTFEDLKTTNQQQSVYITINKDTSSIYKWGNPFWSTEPSLSTSIKLGNIPQSPSNSRNGFLEITMCNKNTTKGLKFNDIGIGVQSFTAVGFIQKDEIITSIQQPTFSNDTYASGKVTLYGLVG